jgi:hypothetical protein
MCFFVCNNVVDRRRVDADPDPTFHFDKALRFFLCNIEVQSKVFEVLYVLC